jgi:predicted phage terminase large subunit-like protein
MATMMPREYKAVLRTDLCTFIERCVYELNPNVDFFANWHIEVIAAKLEAVRLGKIKRLIINVPPRHLKSICASVALIAFWLGHDPTAQIICASYGQDLADKLARDCRAVMMSKFYQDLFRTRLLQMGLQEFTTTQGGFRMATSVGGVLTGRGGDVLVIDDPLKPDEAVSDAHRTSVNQWYDNTLRSRLNSKKDGAIIIIMQRLHEDDLVGHVLGHENWDVVSFPAIAEANEVHSIETIYGPVRHSRAIGDVLHPERESIEVLNQLRAVLGEYNFASQYQQSPAPLGGGMVKESWFKRYSDNERPESFGQIIQSWDTANKPTELSDYSVCTTWGVKESRLYLLNVVRKRLGYPELKREVRNQALLYGPSVILIEDKASGTQLIQELVEEGLHYVQKFKPEYDKIMRLHAQTAAIENGFVYLPREAHWLAEYLHELTTFPKGKYDDQTDSTSQALAWLKVRVPGAGLLEYYCRMAKAQMEGPEIMYRVEAPAGVSTVYTITGRQITVPEDRVILVSSEEMKPLLGAGFRRVDG